MAGILKRPYGDTGVSLSIIGFGGILVMDEEPAQASRIVGEAVERGVDYFDIAPSYGNAQQRLGPALEPYRKDVFLACKTGERTRAGAEREFRQSLADLRTDRFDLYQLHGITDVAKDVDAAFAPGGAMEFLLEARKAGQVRFLGFSAHSEAAALAALERFDFDSVLFPFNFATYHRESFGPRVIEAAEKKGAARLALKALARQKWPEGDPEKASWPKCWYQPLTDRRQADLALRFTLGLPVTAAIPPGDARLFGMALDIAEEFKPLSEPERDELRALASGLDPIFRAA